MPARVSGASTGAGEATTRFAKASRGDMAAAFMQQLSVTSAVRMPQCSVLQGCKLLAVLLRSLRMDACCSARLAGFTAVDSDATRWPLRSNPRAIQLGAGAGSSGIRHTRKSLSQFSLAPRAARIKSHLL